MVTGDRLSLHRATGRPVESDRKRLVAGGVPFTDVFPITASSVFTGTGRFYRDVRCVIRVRSC